VIRLGGNTEDLAVDILQSSAKDLPATVEGYKKTDPPAKIAARFAALVAASKAEPWTPRPPRQPAFVGQPGAMQWPIRGGTLWIDPRAWAEHGPAIVARSAGLLRDDGGRPGVAGDVTAKDSEFIACEVECRRDGVPGVYVELAIPGLNEASIGR
jgi:hypothetical protein